MWKCHLPSGSRSCGMPNSVSASKKASRRFSQLGLPHTRSMSTRLGRSAWISAKKAKPVRQLGPKSFTSSLRRLGKTEDQKKTYGTEALERIFADLILHFYICFYMLQLGLHTWWLFAEPISVTPFWPHPAELGWVSFWQVGWWSHCCWWSCRVRKCCWIKSGGLVGYWLAPQSVTETRLGKVTMCCCY